ncbi:MAG: cytochrome c peroxidase [Pseudomonadota bacterium]
MRSISERALAAVLILCAGAVAAESTWTWTERERRVMRSLSLDRLGEVPASPGNRVADDPAAAALGKALFFDPRFSGNGAVSCATCHVPERDFTDGVPRAIGLGTGNRNTPTITGTAWNRWFYWDGRRDSLWAQALIPFEAVSEMGSDRVSVLRTLAADPDLSSQYRALFGPLPDLDSLPVSAAGPLADAGRRDAWYRLPVRDQQRINRSFANVGKAIAAWERTLRPEDTRFDAYVRQLESGDGQSAVLGDDAKAGARLFMDAERTQCLQCHNGPTLSNGGFHNIGTGNFDGEILDYGRAFGLQAVLLDEFNCLGPYSDATPEACTALRFLNSGHHIPLEGAFKTPGLRGVANTAPYFHDGSAATLTDVVSHYNTPPDRAAVGAHELQALSLDAREIEQLVAFMQALSEPAPASTTPQSE